MTGPAPSRRQLLATATAGIGGVALAACSDDPPAPEGAPTADAAGGLVAVDDVPVGGAVSVEGPDGPVVVGRPAEGEVVAFSAICTHQGCTVAPDGDRLRCPCHGSVFEAATGANVSGPAPRPLDPVEVRVVDGRVVAG